MAIFDVIGVFQNGKITAPPFNPKALVPFEQPIDVVQGEDLVIRMFCQNNDATGLDITNWSFECDLVLAQAPNPAQAAPPPPVQVSRAGIIIAANPSPTVGMPLGGVVEFTFSGISETAFWFPWETDSLTIFAVQPGAPPSQRENFVPPSNLRVVSSMIAFPTQPTPTPLPPTPYTYIFSFPTAQIPDPRTYPLSTVIKNTDTGQLLWNTGTAWLPIPTFVAATPGQWASSPPNDLATAINRLAAAVYALRGNVPIP